MYLVLVAKMNNVEQLIITLKAGNPLTERQLIPLCEKVGFCFTIFCY